jgi:hypothetical protein
LRGTEGGSFAAEFSSSDTPQFPVDSPFQCCKAILSFAMSKATGIAKNEEAVALSEVKDALFQDYVQ